MEKSVTHPVSALIRIIGINPYILLPARVLKQLFAAAGKQSGPIPVKVYIGNARFTQNLVKYQGVWRLYLNTPMRREAGKEVGDRIALQIAFDHTPPVVAPHPALIAALKKDKPAMALFGHLTPSRQKEVHRYLHSLKTPASIEKNIARFIESLHAEGVFLGRKNR